MQSRTQRTRIFPALDYILSKERSPESIGCRAWKRGEKELKARSYIKASDMLDEFYSIEPSLEEAKLI